MVCTPIVYLIIIYQRNFRLPEKLYVFYARTGSLALNSEVDNTNFLDGYDYEYIKTRFSFKRDFTINIPLLQRGNKVFSIIQVDGEKAYDLIKTVVEDLL